MRAYGEASRRVPLCTAFCTCFLKGSASDLVVQGILEERPGIDWRRTLSFGVFSGAYLGVGQHFVYNVAFDRIFGPGRDFFTAAKKVSADAFLHVPFLYLPLYYPFEAVATGKGTVRDGLEAYAHDAPRVLSAYWTTWPAAHFISFTVLPQELRIAFVATLSFLWLCYLSAVSHQPRKNKDNNNTLLTQQQQHREKEEATTNNNRLDTTS